MAEPSTPRRSLLARAAAIAIGGLVLLGLVIYGLPADVLDRVWKNIAERMGGPMAFRFTLQPCMAAIAALADGIKDARTGRDPYLWTILTNAEATAGRLREGFISTARIIVLGLVMDAMYQVTVLKTFYPGEMVLVAILLAFIPYVLLRGPLARLASFWMRREGSRTE